MFTRKTLFALAAGVSIVGAALAPTSASAFGHFGRGAFGGHAHFGFRGHVGLGFRHAWIGHRWGAFRWGGWPRHYWWIRYHRPILAGGGPRFIGNPSMDASAGPGPAAPTGCLTKRYAPDGTVVFRDRCTQEEGAGEPAGASPQAQ